MGLRCLLGHDFGPSGVVREHEQEGSEMVVTEREIRRCRRCGEEQVLSESTEVRAIRSEADVGMDRRDDDAVAPASATQGPDAADADASSLPTDGGGAGARPTTGGGDASPAAGVGDPTPDASALHEAADSVDGPGDDAAAESNTSLIDRAEAGFDDDADPDEEDAVILGADGGGDDERERGAWPDSDGVADDADAGPSPDRTAGTPDGRDADDGRAERDADDGRAEEDAAGAAADDVGTDPDPDPDPERSLADTAAEEDAELLGGGPDDGSDDADGDAGGTADPDTAAAGGSWPSHDDADEDEGYAAGAATAGGPGLAYGNELTPQSTNGESHDDGYETAYRERTVEERDGDGTIVSAGSPDADAVRGVETEYFCPNCEHARPLDSSLRAGDICPECQQGYIAERER